MPVDTHSLNNSRHFECCCDQVPDPQLRDIAWILTINTEMSTRGSGRSTVRRRGKRGRVCTYQLGDERGVELDIGCSKPQISVVDERTRVWRWNCRVRAGAVDAENKLGDESYAPRAGCCKPDGVWSSRPGSEGGWKNPLEGIRGSGSSDLCEGAGNAVKKRCSMKGVFGGSRSG